MTNPNLTHIEFLLDRSGSMSSIRTDIEGGFDTYIADQKTQPGECTVSLAQFDDQYEVVYTALNIAEVPPLDLHPRNMTALLDALGKSINALGTRLSALPEDQRPGTVIFAIMTDGVENASKEYNHSMIKDMITHQEKTYNWQFLYMGADQDAIEVGASMGIRADRSLTYSRCMSANAHTATSRITSKIRAAAAAGESTSDIGYSPEDRKAAGS